MHSTFNVFNRCFGQVQSFQLIGPQVTTSPRVWDSEAFSKLILILHNFVLNTDRLPSTMD